MVCEVDVARNCKANKDPKEQFKLVSSRAPVFWIQRLRFILSRFRPRGQPARIHQQAGLVCVVSAAFKFEAQVSIERTYDTVAAGRIARSLSFLLFFLCVVRIPLFVRGTFSNTPVVFASGEKKKTFGAKATRLGRTILPLGT